MSAVLGVARGLDGHPEGLPAFEYAWLEAPLEVLLAPADDAADWRVLERWPEGRLFGAAGEYRWRLGDDGLHAVLLLDRGELPSPFEHRLDLEPFGESRRFLHGEWIDPEADAAANPDGGPRFFDPALPGVQTYPVDLEEPKHHGKVAALTVQRYRDAEAREGEFLRCVGFTVWRSQEDRHG